MGSQVVRGGPILEGRGVGSAEAGAALLCCIAKVSATLYTWSYLIEEEV